MRPDPILPVVPGLASPPARTQAPRRPSGGDRDDHEPPADVVGGEDRMEHLAMVAATVAPPLRMTLVKREPAFPAVGPARRSTDFHHCDTDECGDDAGASGSGFGCEPGPPGRDLV